MKKYNNYKKNTLMDNASNEDESSNWNMGSYFYLGLYKIKEDMSRCLINKEYDGATLLLIEEIDWVGDDINKDVRDRLITNGNQLLSLVNNKNCKIFDFLQLFINTRRALWDEELRKDITRPGRGIDKSNIPISMINNR